jgi:hypothetical protein
MYELLAFRSCPAHPRRGPVRSARCPDRGDPARPHRLGRVPQWRCAGSLTISTRADIGATRAPSDHAVQHVAPGSRPLTDAID